MSYILDALNKSEQERQHQRLPNLKTSHIPLVQASGNHPIVLIIGSILMSAVVIVAGYLVWGTFFSDRSSTQQATHENLTSMTPAADSKPSIHSASSQPSTQLPNASANLQNSDNPSSSKKVQYDYSPGNIEVSPEDSELSSQSGDIVTPQKIYSSNISPLKDHDSIPDINELPASVKSKIPNLTFSTHIFASEPAWRMVGINGVSRREGDSLDEYLQLVEITEEGVVLKYQQHIFQMSIIRDWSGP
jgi:general secretion pathway protein B